MKQITINGYYFTEVKPGTRAADCIKWDANRRGETDIYRAYGRPSVYKVKAFEDCKRIQSALDGFGGKITGKNCMQFSYCFMFTDPNYGHVRICKITKDHNYVPDA